MEHLQDLGYADDIVLLSQHNGHIQKSFDDVSRCAERVGLRLNVSKTKSMQINTLQERIFEIYGEQIENVDSFTYLGSQITREGGSKLDKTTRIKKAKAAFACLKKIW